MITRRNFIKLSGLALLPLFSPALLKSEVLASHRSPKRLSFLNTHTDEKLSTVYWESGEYLPSAIEDINYILRDHRTDEVLPIDPDLLDLLHALRVRLRTRQPFYVISGYRSRQTNALLSSQSDGVARNSLHVLGKAIDIRVPGRRLPELRKAALSLKRGGVGYYPRYDFIHVDVGRVRSW
jgi:uncharacterized protein YcbK (DUF882 family)